MQPQQKYMYSMWNVNSHACHVDMMVDRSTDEVIYCGVQDKQIRHSKGYDYLRLRVNTSYV